MPVIEQQLPGDVIIPISQEGRYRIPRLYLSSKDFGITLQIYVMDRLGLSSEDPNPSAFRVYYLSPLDVSDAAVTLDLDTAKLSKQFVVDLAAEATNQVSIPYVPPGADNSRRDYSLGGWMFAVPLFANGQPGAGASSGPAPVPTFNKSTVPADKLVTDMSVLRSAPVNGIYTLTVGFVNPAPSFGRTAYVQVWMFNYFNDGAYRLVGIYRLHGSPGDVNGQKVSFKLERDGGGHDITFYFAHANGQRARPFGPALNTFPSVLMPGGCP